MKIDTSTIDQFRIDRNGTVYYGIRQLAQVGEVPLKAVHSWWHDQLRWGFTDAHGMIVMDTNEFISALLLLQLRTLNAGDSYVAELSQRLREISVIESNPIFWSSSDDGAELIGYSEFTRRIHRLDQAFVFDFEEIAHQLYRVVKRHIKTRNLDVPKPKRPRSTKLSGSKSA